MGDKKELQTITKWDKITVLIYRLGIVISTFCFIYAVFALYFVNINRFDHIIFKGIDIVLWTFLISVGVSLIFLHLYDKRILMIIRVFWVISFIIILSLTLYSGVNSIFDNWLGIIGWGFLLAAFSGIGAKEAFCFKLYEGYLFGILSAILVLGNLLFIFSHPISFTLVLMIAFLVTIFTIRKLQHPFHYDIGDKSRY